MKGDKAERKWQDIEYVLSYFGSKGVRKKNYYQYVKEGTDAGWGWLCMVTIYVR